MKKNEAQRKAPLTADERGALLGEAPLTAHQLTGIPSTNQHDAGISLQHDGSISVQQQGLPPPPAVRDKRVPLMNIAEGDRQRIQQALGGNFVRYAVGWFLVLGGCVGDGVGCVSTDA